MTLLPLNANRDTAPAYWFHDSLWLILVDSKDTGGAFSVMEQWMREGAGPSEHVHTCDEWFYILEGSLAIRANGTESTVNTGDSIWLPRGTDHGFTVPSGGAKVLNGYTPGGVEQLFIGLGTPTEQRTLPPPDFPKPTKEQMTRLMTNYWTAFSDESWAHFVPQRD